MWLLLPGSDPSLVSRVEILLVPGLCRVLSPGGGLRSRGGVVSCRVGPRVGPVVPTHHPYTALHWGTRLALRQLQLLYLLLLLLLGLPVSNEPHLDIRVLAGLMRKVRTRVLPGDDKSLPTDNCLH